MQLLTAVSSLRKLVSFSEDLSTKLAALKTQLGASKCSIRFCFLVIIVNLNVFATRGVEFVGDTELN